MHNQITLHSITVMVDSIHPSLTHEASYENRDAFPASHYQHIASGQESGHSSPCATGPILSASQTLYEGDNNDSYNF